MALSTPAPDSADVGLVGLAVMGQNLVLNMADHGFRVAVYNRTTATTEKFVADNPPSVFGSGGGGLVPAAALADFVKSIKRPRRIVILVKAGGPTDAVIDSLVPLLERGDVIVDGGNANYKDSQRRGAALATAGVRFVDCGVSGGIWGLDNGYALMFGGDADAARLIEPYVKILAPAPDAGWLHCGPCGAGHFVKMIHNGIEYGMMQAYAEGFALLKGKAGLGIDVAAVAETWRHGSVVRSWLLDLTAEFLGRDAELADIAPVVADSGEGRWTAQEAIEQGVPAPVMSLALMMRFASQGKSDYGDRLLAMMRLGFGGHAVARKGAPR